MISRRWPILAIVAACMLGVPRPAAATAIAASSIDFKNLAIAPATGTFSLDGPWTLEAFAHADNSLGETDDQFTPAGSPGTASAAAAVTWASAAGAAGAPGDPPDLAVSGSGKSAVNVPGCGPAFASSKGRGTLFNAFSLSDFGDVRFDIDVAGLLDVLTDVCGVEATTEVVFSLAVDGGDPILFYQSVLSIGRSDSASLAFATTLSNTVMLGAGSHFLVLEADSESRGMVEVPEPPAGMLLVAGLAALAAARRRPALLRRMA